MSEPPVEERGGAAAEQGPGGRSFEIPLHELLDLSFEWGDGPTDEVEVRMPVAPPAFGFTGNLHGGAIATMVDLACAVVVARNIGFDPERESLVTSDMHIRYLGRPRTDTVLARSRVVRAGSQLIVVECRVTDDEDHIVAVADFSMMKVPLRRPLSADGVVTPGAPEL